MNSDFQTIAKKVVNDSIRHAVYVDDDIALPFDEEDRDHLKPFCKSLYDSFRKKNCTLDFYRFENRKKLEGNSPLFFKRNDLLVLDWELVNSKYYSTQKETLYLVEEAVNTNSLHFVCIFTKTPRAFEDLIYEIHGYFSAITKKQQSTFKDLINNIDLEVVEISKTIKSLASQFKALVIPENDEEKIMSFNEIDKKLKQELGAEFIRIENWVNTFFSGDFNNAYEKMGFIVNDLNFFSKRPNTLVKAFKKERFLRINHTLVILLPKPDQKDINEHDLFEKFTDSLNRCAGNFLTIMGLELRNSFLEQSGFVGKDLDSIEEETLLYHFDKSEYKENFYAFIKELWKNTVFEGIDNVQQLTFPALSSYKESNEAKRINPSLDSIAGLNQYYNCTYPKLRANPKIKFGDIFVSEKEEFLLCVTPLCDCEHPENIDNQFTFVKGDIYGNLKEAVTKSESRFDSFVKFKNKVICIKW